jgi:hypothetical protein
MEHSKEKTLKECGIGNGEQIIVEQDAKFSFEIPKTDEKMVVRVF